MSDVNKLIRAANEISTEYVDRPITKALIREFSTKVQEAMKSHLQPKNLIAVLDDTDFEENVKSGKMVFKIVEDLGQLTYPEWFDKKADEAF